MWEPAGTSLRADNGGSKVGSGVGVGYFFPFSL